MTDQDKIAAVAPVQPEQIVGRTWADLIANSRTGPKLDAACASLVDWGTNGFSKGRERVSRFLGRVDRELEDTDVEPKAIPERTGLEILENIAKEDREELHGIWAKLMVGAATGFDVDAFYIDIVRRLDVPSSRLFDTASGAWCRACTEVPVPSGIAAFGRGVEVDFVKQQRNTYAAQLIAQSPPNESDRAAATGRLEALGLVEGESLFPTKTGWSLHYLLARPHGPDTT